MQVQRALREQWIIVNDDGIRVSKWYATEEEAQGALENGS